MSQRLKTFLGVEKSISERRWVERLDAREANIALAMTQQHGMDDLIARVLAGRGVGLDEARDFLNPTLRDLMPDPSTLAGMDAAAERIADAIMNREGVAIFGDYDVDGATSAALMARFLRHFGLIPEVWIPDRIFEGYGPNTNAIRELVDNGANLIVTVDCGAASVEALELAKSLGASAVVFDHHQMGVEMPDVAALVNPNRQDDLSGQGHLCAAGVVFLGLVAINRILRTRGYYTTSRPPPDLMSWLDLVAFGTVCDVVPLKGLNRAFVLRGLEIMRHQKNSGITALARVARQEGPATPYHLGFLLGPRINAGGRIGDAGLGARLLISSDPDEAEQIAEQLEMLNRERRAMETVMLKEAVDEADSEIGMGKGPAVLVTERETWHPGVVGLLASRLKDRFRRPAFAISFDERGIGTGSGRSISGVDIGVAVRAAVDEGLLEKGGGHAMAAGITVRRDKLGKLRAFLEERLAGDVTESRGLDVLKVDGALTARAATNDFVERLEHAGPYGAGHPQPVFALPNHRIRYADVVGANHVRFTISAGDGAELRGISFRSADQPLGEGLLVNRGEAMHFIGTIGLNFYKGVNRVQLRLIDAAVLPDHI